MNNFIFENATKTFFGKGCVKEYLNCLVSKYGNTVMLAYGGGSIKRSEMNGDAENVSDDISEALMRGVIRVLRASLAGPQDYNARSSL